MQVTTETVSSIVRRLKVSVASSIVDTEFESRLKRVAKTAKVNGFRPGKVPMSRVRADFGPGVHQEVVNEVIRNSLFDAIQQEEIQVVGTPNIETADIKDDQLMFEATVEVLPEVELNAFDGLEVERKTAEVTDQDVDKMIENLRSQRQTWVKTKGMAKKDMQVSFDFEGSIDGELFEGGSAQDYKLILGSGRMIPGFEDGIIGMKAGEEKTIDVTFPEDYQAEHLATKTAQFKITLKEVEKAKLPEIDDEFLEIFGVKPEEGIDKLKQDVRKNMEREVKYGLRNQLKGKTFDALVNANEVEVPSALVAEEIGRQRKQALQQFSQQFGAEGQPQFDESMLPDALFEEKAKRSVQLGVLVGQVIKDQKVEVDQDRVTAYIEEMAASYEDPSEVIEYFSKDKQQRSQIESLILEDQVIDLILKDAKVTDVVIDYDQLLAEQQQAQQNG